MEYKNTLPGYRLPNPRLSPTSNEDSKTIKASKIKKIESLVKEMAKRPNRTTNFAAILYLVESSNFTVDAIMDNYKSIKGFPNKCPN